MDPMNPMDAPAPVRLRPGQLMARGLRDLVRPPFVILLGVSLLVYAVSASFGSGVNAVAAYGTLILAVLSLYVQMALVLAASSGAPGRGADPWIRMAFTRRVLLRYFLTGIVTVLLAGLGLILVIVGAIIVGGYLGLAQTISVVERAWPPTALRRSAQLAEGNHWRIGAIFGALFLVPAIVTQAGFLLSDPKHVNPALLVLGGVTVVMSAAGLITLTYAYVELTAAEPPAARGPMPAL